MTENLPVETGVLDAKGDMLLVPALMETAQRSAMAFAKSGLVPAHFTNNPGACFVAIHLARNLEIDPFMLMQNMYVVHGKPAFEGKLVIALVNKRGPYPAGVKFTYSGEGAKRSCQAAGKRADGDIDLVEVSLEQVKAMGWYDKNPIWKNATDQMLAYRSATWLARRHCPEVLMGIQTVDELTDIHGITVLKRQSTGVAELISGKIAPENEVEVSAPPTLSVIDGGNDNV